MSHGINAGIRRAIEDGPVRAVSTIVNLPAFTDAVAIAHSLGGSIGVGVHVNLVVGRPLTAARSLVDPATHEFFPFTTQIQRALLGVVREEDVYEEALAQIGRLRERGLYVTHLDGHRHLHLVPGISAGVTRAARVAGIRRVRRPKEPILYDRANVNAVLRKTLLGVACLIRRQMPWESNHVGFFGVSLQDRRDFEARLHRLVTSLTDGTTELMVHPGYAHDLLPAYDDYVWPREVELAALTSRSLREALDTAGVTVTHFGELDESVATVEIQHLDCA